MIFVARIIERDKETRWGFCKTMSHIPVGKGRASEANRATPTIRGSIVEVGVYHDGFYNSLATDIAEA